MSTQWNKLPWSPYIINIVLIQTSILGLGIISILLALISYLMLRGTATQHDDNYTLTQLRWSVRSLLYAGVLHLAGYAIFLTKVFLAESIGDLSFAFLSHGMIHHVLSTGIALFLIYRVVKGLFALPVSTPLKQSLIEQERPAIGAQPQ